MGTHPDRERNTISINNTYVAAYPKQWIYCKHELLTSTDYQRHYIQRQAQGFLKL